MDRNITVIYYTSNRENESFEQKIQNNLLETIEDLPLISVSQKPLGFGKNICVGDIGVSEINCRRQPLIGLYEVKTKYIAVAESDFLYPKEYFEFIPPTDECLYLANPVYVLFVQKGKKCLFSPKKHGSEGALITTKEYFINRLEFILEGQEKWHRRIAPRQDREIPQLLRISKFEIFYTEIPIVTFKTDNNMHRVTPHVYEKRTKDIPYWGNSHELARKFL
jgi:hypothetical protein